MTPAPNEPRPITARVISDANDRKPLGRFGCASVRHVVAEARAMAEQEGVR